VTTRADVLEFFDRRERAALGRPGIAVYDVAHEFRLSMRLATRHVLNLWYDLLIESTSARRRGLRTRLAAHEHLEDIRFRLTERGRKRLAYYQGGPPSDQLPLE
jgi:hypothetical protein